MKNIERLIIAFTFQTIVLSALVLLTPYSNNGQPPTPKVTVVNTPSQPVPVTGSVKVANTTDEPVPVTGSVNVANLSSAPIPVTGSVNVANSLTVSGTVNVGNTILFRPAIPQGAFNVDGAGGSVAFGGVIFRDERATSYAITSITAFNFGSDLAGAQLQGSAASINEPCGLLLNTQAFGPTVRARPGETVHLTFPQPFILRVGGPYSCLTKVTPSGASDSITLTLVGYKFDTP